MPDFSKHSDVLILLKQAQEADVDQRAHGREAHSFLDKRDGQWEPDIINNMRGRPRYTFDKANPIVNQISGRIKQADFDIKVKPAGGEASKDIAEILDGLIRNIENISNSSKVFSAAAKSMVTAGFDGWMVVQDWADGDSFDQDLFIRPVANFIDSVWFDTNSQLQDRSDSEWAFKLTSFSLNAYNKKWPKGSGMSVEQDRTSDSYFNKPDNVVVGEFYRRKPVKRELVQMNNGQVFVVDEDFEKIRDELAAANITEQSRRTRTDHIVTIRQFDGGKWLDKEKDTVFRWVPLIPTYGNFKVTENKIIWRGAVEKIMDPCRVSNYAESRKIEEGALAPREKLMMTMEQAEGHTEELKTMNTNAEPVQFYNHVDGQPSPFKMQGAMINQGLSEVSQSANLAITQAAGLFAANMGDNPGLQSGVAIDSLKESGDIGTIDYFEAQEIAICHTARILVDAIPGVYDTERQVRILSEDGSFDMQTLNQRVVDEQTGEVVVLTDLSKGRYDVTCSVGKSFASRQQETVAAITEVMGFDPTAIQGSEDILYSNITAPGMDLIGERKRQHNFNAGMIPESQWTEEERQQVQQAQEQAQNNPPQPDPAMVLAQAEQTKAEADVATAQNDTAKVQIEAQKLQLDAQRLELDRAEAAAKAENDSIKAESDRIKAVAAAEQAGANVEKIQIDAAKVARDMRAMDFDELTRIANGI